MSSEPRPGARGVSRSDRRRRRRRLPGAAAILAASLSGCASQGLLRWTEPAESRVDPGPAPALPPITTAEASDRATLAKLEPKATTGGDRAERTNDPRVATVATSSTDPNIPPVITPPVVPPAPADYPLDLTTALRLAEVENPEIAGARQLIREALALQLSARVLALPTLNAGTNYHGHTGNLQRSSGKILSLAEQSLYLGGGTRTLAAESLAIPAVNIVSPLADVLFEPLVARQNVDRARSDTQATINTILLDVSTLYFDLIQAEGSLALYRESEAEAAEITRLTKAYWESGNGRQSDYRRALSGQKLLHVQVQHAEEETAVASARLARRLHLDPVVRFHPITPWVGPINLMDLNVAPEELVQVAIRRRPEVAARSATIGIAETRYHQERARPFLPVLWVGFSGGGFGGGSNLVQPLLGNFGGRTDFDVRAYWTLQNLGFGNLAIQKARRAQIGQALGLQSRTINEVRREVTAARAEAIAARERIDATRKQLLTGQDGFREDLDAIRGFAGRGEEVRPIEVTENLDLLTRARQMHLQALLDYNRAQFRLFVSLGSPPPLDRPATDPLPPAPIASPPLPLPPAR